MKATDRARIRRLVDKYDEEYGEAGALGIIECLSGLTLAVLEPPDPADFDWHVAPSGERLAFAKDKERRMYAYLVTDGGEMFAEVLKLPESVLVGCDDKRGVSMDLILPDLCWASRAFAKAYRATLN